jgi:hypothetical protein
MSDDFIIPSDYIRPAPNTSEARRDTPWELMDAETLFFAWELLSLHGSPFIGGLLAEIDRREALGKSIDMDSPPPPLHDLPAWLQKWPFRLLWKHRIR